MKTAAEPNAIANSLVCLNNLTFIVFNLLHEFNDVKDLRALTLVTGQLGNTVEDFHSQLTSPNLSLASMNTAWKNQVEDTITLCTSILQDIDEGFRDAINVEPDHTGKPDSLVKRQMKQLPRTKRLENFLNSQKFFKNKLDISSAKATFDMLSGTLALTMAMKMGSSSIIKVSKKDRLDMRVKVAILEKDSAEKAKAELQELVQSNLYSKKRMEMTGGTVTGAKRSGETFR